MRISDWSSDVCSSDLRLLRRRHRGTVGDPLPDAQLPGAGAAGTAGGLAAARHGTAGDHRPLDGRAWRADAGAARSRPVPLGIGVRADLLAAELPMGRQGAGRLSRTDWKSTRLNSTP